MTKFFLKSNMLIYMTNIFIAYWIFSPELRWYYRFLIIIRTWYWGGNPIAGKKYEPYELIY